MQIIPWSILIAVVILGTIGQLSLKYALQTVSARKSKESQFAVWHSGYFWLWFACYILVTGLWLFVLRSIPLSQAFPALGLTFALIPVGSYFFLKEEVRLLQWIGISAIVAGAILVVQT